MKVLITGATGFVARYLASELLSSAHQVVLTSSSHSKIQVDGRDLPATICNLADPGAVKQLVQETKPEAIVHLSGISEPNKPQTSAENFINANVLSTYHLGSALSQSNRAGSFLYASSAFIYGRGPGGNKGITEEDLPAPEGAYACSKFAAESIATAFRSQHLHVTVVRPFNHIGPYQRVSFVCAAFAARVASAKEGDTISVGNLSAYRDFSDVRDIVRAYRLILEKRSDQGVFVLGSGKAVKVETVLKKLIEISGKKLQVEVDPKLFKKHDAPHLVSNPKLAKSKLDWECRIPLEKTLSEIYHAATLSPVSGK